MVLQRSGWLELYAGTVWPSDILLKVNVAKFAQVSTVYTEASIDEKMTITASKGGCRLQAVHVPMTQRCHMVAAADSALSSLARSIQT